MTATLPRTIPEYLEQLRAALAGADPALVQDALYDAEEYLRSELAEQAGRSEQHDRDLGRLHDADDLRLVHRVGKLSGQRREEEEG